MLDTLRAWLNGTRDYNTGAELYKILGTDEKLKALFAQGHNLYRNFRLQEELLAICTQLKEQKNIDNNSKVLKSAKKGTGRADQLDEMLTSITDQVAKIAKTISPANPELYTACKLEADKLYKEAMNKRAVLFSMIPSNKYEDANRQDLVAGRKDLALQVVKLYNRASELYDRADHVKLYGRLPDQDEPGEDETAQLQDHEVKAALDNARKAYNKLKGKEQTAERIVLMQKHELNIEKLEARWLSLKLKK